MARRVGEAPAWTLLIDGLPSEPEAVARIAADLLHRGLNDADWVVSPETEVPGATARLRLGERVLELDLLASGEPPWDGLELWPSAWASPALVALPPPWKAVLGGGAMGMMGLLFASRWLVLGERGLVGFLIVALIAGLFGGLVGAMIRQGERDAAVREASRRAQEHAAQLLADHASRVAHALEPEVVRVVPGRGELPATLAGELTPRPG